MVAYGLRSTIAVTIIAWQGSYKTAQSEYGEDRDFDERVHLDVDLCLAVLESGLSSLAKLSLWKGYQEAWNVEDEAGLDG